jgi:putative hydrolase of the HAD superfamily
MGSVRLALFDLDDTLFDHRYSYRGGLAALRRRWPELRGRSWEDTVEAYDRSLALLHPLVLRGSFSSSQARRARIRALFQAIGVDPDGATLRQAEEVYADQYRALRRAVPGAIALLRRLRSTGIQIGVVTNHEIEPQIEKIRAIGVESLVDHLTISEAVGAAKPDPAIFEAALRAASVPASAAVMIGDSWENDVMGAQRAGIRPIWFRRERGGPRDRSVTSLRSFRPVERSLRTIQITPRKTPEPPR